jgi:hypothetical protein
MIHTLLSHGSDQAQHLHMQVAFTEQLQGRRRVTSAQKSKVGCRTIIQDIIRGETVHASD